jgi:mRNA interferase MazF
MNFKRGDVGMVRFPHSGGTRGKRRPVVVVQADSYNLTRRHVIVAEATTNLAALDASALLIDVTTSEGRATGLNQNSVVSCLFLATVAEDRIGKAIGKLSPAMMRQLDGCLKAALELP